MDQKLPLLNGSEQEFTFAPVATVDPDDNTTDILVRRVNAHPNEPLFAVQRDDGTWRDIAGHTFLAQVRALAKGLIDAGLEPGQRVGIMSHTRYQWPLIDFAIWFAGLVSVPIYETSSPAQIAWNLRDSGAMAVIVENASMRHAVNEIKHGCADLNQIYTIDDGDLERLSIAGRNVDDAELERRRTLATLNDLATIIYTSGTTGKPRGVMISHGNLVITAVNGSLAMADVLASGPTLMFITLAHVLARFLIIACLNAGTKVGFEPNTKHLVPALKSFKPGFLLAVPRVFEKVYNSAIQQADEQHRGRVMRMAANVAVAYSKALDDGQPSPRLKLLHAVYDKLVFRKIRQSMGGSLQYAVSGSAPLGTYLGHFFRGIGIRVLEGYGLTESTAPATVNMVSHAKIGTVGYPFPGTSIKTDANGRILLKGPHIFIGYWQDPTATAEQFTDDGWLITGDIGSLDSDGYLTITGREKDLIVTAGGKNVAPAVLEDPIRANPLVAQVIVVGDQRPFVGALITLDYEMLPAWLETHNMSRDLSKAEILENPVVLKEIRRAITRSNNKVSRAESIRKFVLLPDEFDEHSKYLTPSLKVKRHDVLIDFKDTLDRLYNDPQFGRYVVGDANSLPNDGVTDADDASSETAEDTSATSELVTQDVAQSPTQEDATEAPQSDDAPDEDDATPSEPTNSEPLSFEALISTPGGATEDAAPNATALIDVPGEQEASEHEEPSSQQAEEQSAVTSEVVDQAPQEPSEPTEVDEESVTAPTTSRELPGDEAEAEGRTVNDHSTGEIPESSTDRA